MNSNIFVNIGIDTAIKKYILFVHNHDKQFETDFLVYTIMMLIKIYGEESIIMPYLKKDNGGNELFINNLKQYGAEEELVSKFLNDIVMYLEKDNYNKVIGNLKNSFFTYIQEDLIDFYFLKAIKLNISDNELEEFKKLLFSSETTNQKRKEMNKLYAIEEEATINYFNKKNYQRQNNIEFKEIKQEILDMKIYELFGFNKEDIDSLNQNNISQINQRIYTYCDVNPLEPNSKDKILKKMTKHQLKLCNNSGKANIAIFISFIIVIIIIGVAIGIKLVR